MTKKKKKYKQSKIKYEQINNIVTAYVRGKKKKEKKTNVTIISDGHKLINNNNVSM